MEVKKMDKINDWLINDSFLREVNFPDIYYLETLCYKIHSFLKNVPIPVYTSYDIIHNSIYFMVGQNKKFFPLDVDISYYDYITLVKEWLQNFYPQYKVSFNQEVEYNDSEILEIIEKEGISLNDALLRKKVVTINEYCIIDKVYLTKDSFVLYRYQNDQLISKEVRISGSILDNNILTLSKFLDGYRNLLDQQASDEEKKNFIEKNSKITQFLPLKDSLITVNYYGKMMINFFKINYPLLKDKPLVQIDEFVYEWGRFNIIFESRLLRDDCINLYSRLKEN